MKGFKKYMYMLIFLGFVWLISSVQSVYAATAKFDDFFTFDGTVYSTKNGYEAGLYTYDSDGNIYLIVRGNPGTIIRFIKLDTKTNQIKFCHEFEGPWGYSENGATQIYVSEDRVILGTCLKINETANRYDLEQTFHTFDLDGNLLRSNTLGANIGLNNIPRYSWTELPSLSYVDPIRKEMFIQYRKGEFTDQHLLYRYNYETNSATQLLNYYGYIKEKAVWEMNGQVYFLYQKEEQTEIYLYNNGQVNKIWNANGTADMTDWGMFYNEGPKVMAYFFSFGGPHVNSVRLYQYDISTAPIRNNTFQNAVRVIIKNADYTIMGDYYNQNYYVINNKTLTIKNSFNPTELVPEPYRSINPDINFLSEKSYYIRYTTGDYSNRIYHFSKALTINTAPLAPEALQVDGQANNTLVSRLNPAFTAIYKDEDMGDMAGKIEIQIGTVSGNYNIWNSGQIAIIPTARDTRSPAVVYTGSAVLQWGTKYFWRCRFVDSKGAVGAWSAEATFTMHPRPLLTLTFPTAQTYFQNETLEVRGSTSNPSGTVMLKYDMVSTANQVLKSETVIASNVSNATNVKLGEIIVLDTVESDSCILRIWSVNAAGIESLKTQINIRVVNPLTLVQNALKGIPQGKSVDIRYIILNTNMPISSTSGNVQKINMIKNILSQILDNESDQDGLFLIDKENNPIFDAVPLQNYK